MKETKDKKEKKIWNWIKKHITKKVIVVFIILAVIGGVVVAVPVIQRNEADTVKLRLENIGELATQCAYCTEVKAIDVPRKIFNEKITVPFTQSKYIFSMDFAIKAGFNFEEIDWKQIGDKIIVTMPEVKILSSESNPDSLKVYHEEESIFRQIHLDEVFDAEETMKKEAEKRAVDNGLFENAKTNAETIITNFLAQKYDLEDYTIEYKYVKEVTNK